MDARGPSHARFSNSTTDGARYADALLSLASRRTDRPAERSRHRVTVDVAPPEHAVTVIREVDLSQPLAALVDLPASRCMLVFRWGRRVIGRAFAHANAGSIGAAELEALAASSLDPAA